jgi:homogentisate 1,2-dioxygenase
VNTTDLHPGYQSGFGNEFATEALPGALPAAPQLAAARRLRPVCRAVVRHRLHRAARAQPAQLAVPHPPGAMHQPFRQLDNGRIVSRFDEVAVPPNQLRWDPLPMPDAPPTSSTAG